MKGPEFVLQEQVAEWLWLQHPRLLWWHCGQTAISARHGANLKKIGVRAGVPDLTFLLPPNGRAAFIELKAGKGKQSDSQETFETLAKERGALYAVCRSIEEVQGTLTAWLAGGMAA